MSVMLGDMAVTEVVRYLNEALVVIDLSNTTAPTAYKYEKPEKFSGEYIAVNHLPFVHKDAVGEGVVNINIHVPKLKNNDIPTKRLAVITKAVVDVFYPEALYLSKAYYEFLSDSRPTLDNDGTYYVNIQLNVTFNNLNR
ncbi:hypothetical protein SAMN04487851_11492 [Prevotella sp. tc2-28]|uniref:hypothetical protein n=1 Tax=Prevotella sp. tc2-28 TaxID=1761888 RepID=UPI000896A8F9|nr:hypothetical protein [Prevotella sp. tc2-28]SEA80474.1 hypothetical protein SAMN04487851_11492 [Prevotella sp. tc2-28]